MRIAGRGKAPQGAPLAFRFEGAPIEAFAGETIAAALIAAGHRSFRHSAQGGMRGIWCGMGVCQECLVTVDDEPNRRACMTEVRAGQRVTAQVAHPMPCATAVPAPTPGPATPCDILVIGAGPAGLHATLAARAAGARVTLVDERGSLGGQYFKPLAKAHRPVSPQDAQARAGLALAERVRASGAEILAGAAVWGAFAPDEIAIGMPSGGTRFLAPRRVILATGAHERALPFPGWTLPGVMTTGAGQTLARAWRVAPGRRVVIAGNGPLNLQLAVELLEAGIEVVALAEAAPPPRDPAALLAMARSAPGLLARGLRDRLRLLRAGVPVLHRHLVRRAEGEGALARVTLMRIDAAGVPVPGSERIFEADALCCGYGFQPQNELARALGCAQHWDAQRRMLVTTRDETGRSSLDQVFVVGDGAGLGGARVAAAEGHIAGAVAAADLGHAPDEAALRRVRQELARARRFQAALWSLYRAPDPGWQLAEGDTPICRCEGVTRGSLEAAIAAAADSGAAKRATRCGMGRCQGRYCAPLLAAAVAAAQGGQPTEEAYLAPRAPAKPVALRDIAQGAEVTADAR
ncbi:FAD-dependent oxidoreductase [Falsiroseomonas sp.]|uniref:FAD-dependent oxidoreductase n=1 Tax=Falsiroseomonas sp. TaxID=2870721 RepID=UPI0035664A1A